MYLAAADPTQMTSSRPIPNNIWLTPHSTWWQLIQPKWRALVPYQITHDWLPTLPGGIWSNPNDKLSSHFYLWHSLYLVASDPTQMTSYRPISIFEPSPYLLASDPSQMTSYRPLSIFYIHCTWRHLIPPKWQLSSHFNLWHSLYLVASDPTQMTSYRPIFIFDTHSTWWQLIPPKWRALVPCPAASHRPPPGPDQDQCHHKQVLLHTGLYCIQLTPPLMFSIFVSHSYL